MATTYRATLARRLTLPSCGGSAILSPMSGYKLVGMLDSPFVRRVAIALELYELAYENLPLRTVGDAIGYLNGKLG